jgi:CRP-like cAMP-binding protein
MSEPIDQEILKNLVPINSLHREPMHELAHKAVKKVITAGRYVFKIGDEDKTHNYILAGEVSLLNENGDVLKTIKGGTPDASHPLSPMQPRQVSARVTADATILTVDSNHLDFLLSWDQSGTVEVGSISGDPSDGEETDWMTKMLTTKAFHTIPPSNLQNLFVALEEVDFKQGDIVIKQGDPGDYFYIIKEGKCQALLESEKKPEGIPLATLTVGDSFGEEALISDKKRSATIKMLTDGALMRLSKEEFNNLLQTPLMKTVSFEEAKEKLTKGGAKMLDVRLPAEYQKWNIKGSINIPLQFLRKKIDTLDPSAEYVVVCDNGTRSRSAGYLLNERGFTAFVLEDGLQRVMPKT